MKIARFGLMFVFVSISLLVAISGVTFARSSPNNKIETERKALCNTSSPVNIYGAVWVNGSSTTSWTESLTVEWDATTVTAYMQTTAFMCSNASTASRTNVRIQNLSSQNGSGYIPLSFDDGTTISRGTMYRDEFSSTGSRAAGLPGILPIKLDVTGLATGTYNIRYRGEYADNVGTGQSSTYTTTIRLVRKPKPQTATLMPTAGVDQTINVGATAVFTTSISSSNVNSGNTDTFTWRVTATGPVSYGARATSSPVAIAGGNPRTGSLGNFTTGPINTPGRYCRTIEIVSKGPSYVVAPTLTATQCFNVVQAPKYNPITAKTSGSDSVHDYEKGGTLPVFNHQINIVAYPCDATIGQNNQTWVEAKQWKTEPYTTAGINGVGGLVAGTLEFENCGNEIRINGTTIIAAPTGTATDFTTYNIPASSVPTLNASDPGSKFARNTYIQGGTPEENHTLFLVFEVPFTRFFGNDVLACGPGTQNRFSFDTGVPRRGAFSEYASFYLNGNTAPNNDYTGLNSAIYNGFPAALDSNWAGMSCVSDITAEDMEGVVEITSENYVLPAIAPGERRTFKVNGNVTITNDFSLADSAPFNPDTQPVVLILATGNINISSNVREIEAVLVAGGSINTCTTSTGAPIGKPDWELVLGSGGCRNSLKITGAVTANTVNFQRAIGTRLLADSEFTTTVNAGNGTASEIVEYPWYLNFVNLELTDRSISRYNAYYALPPRL